MTMRLFRGLLAAAVLCAPATAAAQTSTSDPVPPGTLTLGPLRITPSLLLRDMGIDNNVFNEPVDPKTDYTATITPRADLALRIRRLHLSFGTATDYVYYQKYESERGTNTTSQARIDLDVGALKPYFTIQGVNTRSRANAEVDARARHHDVAYGTGVSFKLASRTSVVVNAAQTRVAYDEEDPNVEFNGFLLTESFNGRRRTIDTGLAFALTPITSFSVLVAREEQRFEASPGRDSDAWRVSPTLNFDPAGLVNGSATFGYRRFVSVSPSLSDYSGFVSLVNVGATIYTRHQMQARFVRDVQYSYDVSSAYYLNTGGTLTWTYLLAGPLDIRGTAGRTRMDYSVADETLGREHLTTYGGGIGYRFGARARLGVNAEWVRRDSTQSAERAYRNHRIFAGLTWGATL
jgi:hypothetical protein